MLQKTYELLKRYNHWNLGGLEYNCAWFSNVIAYIILLILYIWLLILQGFFTVDAIGNLVVNIIGLIVGAALLFGALYLVLTYLAFIPSTIAARGKMTVYESDLEEIEKIWAEVDPEKKAELERRREEKAKRWEEERRRKEAARLAEERKATIHFDARGVHHANNLTVYVDGDRKCSFDGGNTRSVKVNPGYHTIQVNVCNDSADDAYSLNPISDNFEPYKEYDITI